MRRTDNFGFRVSDIERAMIADLARRLQRSESDAVRLVIREALMSLRGQAQTPTDVAYDTTQRAGVRYATAR